MFGRIQMSAPKLYRQTIIGRCILVKNTTGPLIQLSLVRENTLNPFYYLGMNIGTLQKIQSSVLLPRKNFQ